MSSFIPYVKPAKVEKTPRVKPAKVEKTPRVVLDQATIERTNPGGKGFLVHLTVTATQRIGLVVGDRVEMAYDPESGRFAFRKTRKNAVNGFVCQAHGSNPRRVKWGITEFLKAHDLIDAIDGQKIAANIEVVDGWQTF